MKRKPYDPTLKTQPWRISAVWAPIEQVLSRIARSGEVDAVQGRPVFYEDSKGGWYEIAPALRGCIDFHRLAGTRHGLTADVAPLEKIANKLDAGTPIFMADLDAAFAAIAQCKRAALSLRITQALRLVDDCRIKFKLEEVMGQA